MGKSSHLHVFLYMNITLPDKFNTDVPKTVATRNYSRFGISQKNTIEIFIITNKKVKINLSCLQINVENDV